MEAAITDLMLGKSSFGATPMGGSVKKITNLLTKDMMPKVLAHIRLIRRNSIGSLQSSRNVAPPRTAPCEERMLS